MAKRLTRHMHLLQRYGHPAKAHSHVIPSKRTLLYNSCAVFLPIRPGVHQTSLNCYHISGETRVRLLSRKSAPPANTASATRLNGRATVPPQSGVEGGPRRSHGYFTWTCMPPPTSAPTLVARLGPQCRSAQAPPPSAELLSLAHARLARGLPAATRCRTFSSTPTSWRPRTSRWP